MCVPWALGPWWKVPLEGSVWNSSQVHSQPRGWVELLIRISQKGESSTGMFGIGGQEETGALLLTEEEATGAARGESRSSSADNARRTDGGFLLLLQQRLILPREARQARSSHHQIVIWICFWSLRRQGYLREASKKYFCKKKLSQFACSSLPTKMKNVYFAL